MTTEIKNQEMPIDLYGAEVSADGSLPIEKAKKRFIFSPFGLVIMAAVVLFVGVIAYGIYQNEQGAVKVGEAAPDFTLKTYDGEEIKLSEYRGNTVVVLNFWHSQCPPCHDEAETLESVYKAYKDQGVIFIGINVKDPDRVAFEFMDKYGITYPNGLDIADKINKEKYRITGYPETFIVDREGIVRLHHVGPISDTKLRLEIEEALGQS